MALSCQDLEDSGYTVAHTYEIDPDGAGDNEPPFSVHCEVGDEAATTEIQAYAQNTVRGRANYYNAKLFTGWG